MKTLGSGTTVWSKVEALWDSFRYSRDRAGRMLTLLRQSIERRGQDDSFGPAARLLQAATDTYALAVAAAAANSVNWLLVHNLLIDAEECLRCADNPLAIPLDRARATGC
jgi:hypothetical protein